MEFLRFYSFKEWELQLHRITDSYGCLRTMTVGKSHDGRNIYEIQLGTHPRCLICAGGIHGREWVNPVLLLHLIEEYAQAVADIKKIGPYDPASLLSESSLCFVPMVNPDGYVIATEGVGHERWKENARGMDINRNFPGKSWHRGNGPWPASELETKALIQVFCSHPQSLGFLDFHSRGKLIYYYRNYMGRQYNRKSRRLAETMAKACGYRLGKPSEEIAGQSGGGNSVHYYSEYFKRPAITVETVDESVSFPIGEEVLSEAYREIRLLPLLCLQYLTRADDRFFS